MDSKTLYKWTEQEDLVHVNNNIIPQEDVADESQESIKKVSSIAKKRGEVKQNMPEGVSVFRQRQALVLNGKYRFFDSKGNAHNAKRLEPSSKYMKPVLDSLKAIDDLLSKACSTNDIEPVKNSFLKACIACENYLDNRNPWTDEGKARKQMVRDFYTQIKHESLLLNDKISKNQNDAGQFEEGLTWLDILRDVRTAEYTHGIDGVEISKTGANASDVYIVAKNGQKLFFKQNEKIENKSFTELVDEALINIEKSTAEYEMEEHTEEEKVKVRNDAKLRSDFFNLLKTFLINRFRNDMPALEKFFRKIEEPKDFLKEMAGLTDISADNNPFKTVIDEDKRLNNELLQLEMEIASSANKKPSVEEVKRMEKRHEQKLKEIKESNYSFCLEQVNKIKKTLFADNYATTVAHIDVNEELSKRNAATSRMAKILGLDHLVAKSEMATVTINGKKMTGIVMEQAKGLSLARVIDRAKDSASPWYYDPGAFKDILSLQVFDIICGQCDRHLNNYFSSYEWKGNELFVKSAVGIDNDMSFGKLYYEEIVKDGLKGHNVMRNMEIDGKMSIPCIDHALAMRILALKESVIDMQMADILSKDERKALISRVKGVKKVLNKQLQLEAGLRRKNRRFTSKFIRDDNNPNAWSNALTKYKDLIKKAEENENRIISVRDYIHLTTYLRTEALRN